MKKKQVFAIGIALLLAYSQLGMVAAAEETAYDEYELTDANETYDEYELTDVDEAYDEYELTDADETHELLDAYEYEDYHGYIADGEMEAPIWKRDNGAVVYAADNYERYYNQFEMGNMPAIRNQGSEGTCWAFAAIGAVEIAMIVNHNASTSIDYSELQLAYFTAHDYDDPKDCSDADKVWFEGADYLNNGGNGALAYRALISKIGPINEEYAPYSQGPGLVLDDKYAVGYNAAQVKNVFKISPKDSDAIKWAVKNYGSVAISMYMGSHYYNSTYKAYFSDVGKTNHAVLIVGWNDDFPASNFSADNRPAGDGAWLIRNSYGGGGADANGYGRNAYFWMSYYEPSFLGSNSAYAYDVSPNVYDNVYSYDNNPISYSIYPVAGWGRASQKYSVEAGEVIRAVGFDTRTPGLIATVTVKDEYDRSVTGTVSTEYAGYYTIDFDEELFITEDGLVTVEIEYQNRDGSDSTIDIMCEPDSGVTSRLGDGICFTNEHTAIDSKISYRIESGLKIVGTINRDLCMKLYTDNVSESVSIAGFGMTVDGMVGVDAYIYPKGVDPRKVHDYYVEVSCNNKSERVYLTQQSIQKIDDKDTVCYKVTCNMAAKDMGAEIEYHLYNADGEEESWANSNMSDEIGYSYSVYKYLQYLQDSKDAKLSALAKSMMAYGQVAACYFEITSYDDFEYDLSSLIGWDDYYELIDSVSAIDADKLQEYSKTVSGGVSGLDYCGTSLLLVSGTTIRHYFYLEEGYDIGDFTFAVDGVKVTPIDAGGLYYFDINNSIIATNYCKEYKFTINGNELVLYYSVYSYLYDAMVKAIDTDDAVLRDLAGYMYLYGQNAAAYYRD